MSTWPVPLMKPERMPGSLYVLWVESCFRIYAREKRGEGLQRDHDTSFVVLVFELLEVLLGPGVLRVPVFIIYNGVHQDAGLSVYHHFAHLFG